MGASSGVFVGRPHIPGRRRIRVHWNRRRSRRCRLAVDCGRRRTHVEGGNDMPGGQLHLVDVAIGEAALRISGVVSGDRDPKRRLLPFMGVAAGIVAGENDGGSRNRLARIEGGFQREPETWRSWPS